MNKSNTIVGGRGNGYIKDGMTGGMTEILLSAYDCTSEHNVAFLSHRFDKSCAGASCSRVLI